ncbi:MAG: Hsp70 family protein [bacterium]
MRAVGIDFGTTNSALAVTDAQGTRLATFAHDTLDVFRSVLYLTRRARGSGVGEAFAGPDAIARYLDDGEGRLIQSIKSYLASPAFRETSIFDRGYSLGDLLSYFLRALRGEAEASLGPLGRRAVVGRPVRFAGEGATDEALALDRLRGAFAAAGFDDVQFELEPVGAAWAFGARVDRERVVLVGDFGGGTSDFSLLRIAPDAAEVIGNDGEPIAGDVFDGHIVRNVVAPALGRGTRYRGLDKTLEVPHGIYGNLERWHLLSFLKERRTLQQILEWAAHAEEPEKLQGLLHLVRADRGFFLHAAVQAAKADLSRNPSTTLRFQDGPIDLAVDIRRADFEAWIADDVARMGAAVDRLLGSAPGVAIDEVFLTGGTSLVPAVRRLFDDRFGAARVHDGGEFTSVAVGLARRAGALPC